MINGTFSKLGGMVLEIGDQLRGYQQFAGAGIDINMADGADVVF